MRETGAAGLDIEDVSRRPLTLDGEELTLVGRVTHHHYIVEHPDARFILDPAAAADPASASALTSACASPARSNGSTIPACPGSGRAPGSLDGRTSRIPGHLLESESVSIPLLEPDPAGEPLPADLTLELRDPLLGLGGLFL